MNIKSFFVFAIVFFASIHKSNAQQPHKRQNSIFGASAGLLSYTGRYSVQSSFMNHTSGYASVFYKQKLIDNLSLKAELMAGQLRADNTSLTNTTRQLGFFKTVIAELSAKAEYDFLDIEAHKSSPYAFAGAGLYTLMGYKSTSGDKTVAGDKLGFVLPVGGGYKYKINNNLQVFLEGNVRLLSKNLDNVTSGTTNKNNPNKYYSLGIGLIYTKQKTNQLW